MIKSLVVFLMSSFAVNSFATSSEVIKGPVVAVIRSFTIVQNECERKFKQNTTTGKIECVVNGLPAGATDLLVSSTKMEFKVGPQCSIHAVSTATGYVLTISAPGGMGDGDFCFHDAFKRTNIGKTTLNSVVYRSHQ